jgi:hypothetical protein
LASEGLLKAGGYQKYPPAIRRGAEAKYGAKKGISERGSDLLMKGMEKQGE